MGIFFFTGVQKQRARTASGNFTDDIHLIRAQAIAEWEVQREVGFTKGMAYLFAKWETILPPYAQLGLLYFSLIMLCGVGAVLFNICEYNNETTLLAERLAFMETIETRYEENDTQKELIITWREIQHEFMDFNKWEITYASFFAATTYTTIGFGIQYTKTQIGKLFVFVYSVPAMTAYVFMSNYIGKIFLELCGDAFMLCLSEKAFAKHRTQILAFSAAILFLIMTGVIAITATDYGFGQGIYSYFDAAYFLFTTTLTIGYGDVMMSGQSNVLSLTMGCWLATTLGVILRCITELTNAVKQTTESNLRKSFANLDGQRHAASFSHMTDLENSVSLSNMEANKHCELFTGVKDNIEDNIEQPNFELEAQIKNAEESEEKQSPLVCWEQ